MPTSAPWCSTSQLNLLQDFSHLGTFDVIFCRNVLIYFDQDTKASIFERMARMIEADGVLALGAAESVVGITDAFKPYPDRRGMYCPNTARGLRVRASRCHSAVASRARAGRMTDSETGALAEIMPQQNRVRQKPRRVAGDRILVLADR